MLLEISLFIFAFFSPQAEMILARSRPLLIKDEALSWKGNPEITGHDQAGFRNASALQKADLVILGDSQSYGFGLDAKSAWPERLKEISGQGLSVYNMALPGYGPVQQLLLMDRALAMRPKRIIYAFYAGNDFYEAYAMVYDSQKRPDLKTAQPDVLKSISEAENRKKILDEIKSHENACGVLVESAPRKGMKDWIASHSKIYGLFRAVYRVYRKQTNLTASGMAAQETDPGKCLYFGRGRLKTFFTPRYRLTGLSKKDPRIREGFQITLRAIAGMAEKAAASGTIFGVLVIPTKETVFYRKVLGAQSEVPAEYRELAESEIFYLENLTRFLSDRKIPFKQLLPDFENSLNSGTQPYFDSSDNHLSEAGQRLTAQEVNAWLLESSQGALKGEASI